MYIYIIHIRQVEELTIPPLFFFLLFSYFLTFYSVLRDNWMHFFVLLTTGSCTTVSCWPQGGASLTKTKTKTI